jgi:IS5 family transposase
MLKRYRWMNQQTLYMASNKTFENHRKPLRRNEFLLTIEMIVPWAALSEVIKPVIFN